MKKYTDQKLNLTQFPLWFVTGFTDPSPPPTTHVVRWGGGGGLGKEVLDFL